MGLLPTFDKLLGEEIYHDHPEIQVLQNQINILNTTYESFGTWDNVPGSTGTVTPTVHQNGGGTVNTSYWQVFVDRFPGLVSGLVSTVDANHDPTGITATDVSGNLITAVYAGGIFTYSGLCANETALIFYIKIQQQYVYLIDLNYTINGSQTVSTNPIILLSNLTSSISTSIPPSTYVKGDYCNVTAGSPQITIGTTLGGSDILKPLTLPIGFTPITLRDYKITARAYYITFGGSGSLSMAIETIPNLGV